MRIKNKIKEKFNKKNLQERTIKIISSEYFSQTASQCLIEIANCRSHMKIFYINIFKEHLVATKFDLTENDDIIKIAKIYVSLKVY